MENKSFFPVPRPNSTRGKSPITRGSVPRPNLSTRGGSPRNISRLNYEKSPISPEVPKLGFENIPDEIIYEMCEDMSINELGNFIQTSKQYYNICHDIFTKRKQEEENKRRIIEKIDYLVKQLVKLSYVVLK